MAVGDRHVEWGKGARRAGGLYPDGLGVFAGGSQPTADSDADCHPDSDYHPDTYGDCYADFHTD